MNGESTSMVWPTLGSRTAKEQEQLGALKKKKSEGPGHTCPVCPLVKTALILRCCCLYVFYVVVPFFVIDIIHCLNVLLSRHLYK